MEQIIKYYFVCNYVTVFDSDKYIVDLYKKYNSIQIYKLAIKNNNIVFLFEDSSLSINIPEEYTTEYQTISEEGIQYIIKNLIKNPYISIGMEKLIKKLSEDYKILKRNLKIDKLI